MAGADASRQEKDHIRQLFRDGYEIDEVRRRFPHVDGRVISGVAAKLRQEAGPPEAPTPGSLPPPPSSIKAPKPGDKGVKAEAVRTNQATGFTPAGGESRIPEGYQPSYREWWLVRKMDGPDAGIKGEEYPPFSIQDFIHKYKAPGLYELAHHVDGRMVGTYRERVAKPEDAGQIVHQPLEKKQDSPVDSFFRTLEAVKTFQDEAKVEGQRARAAEASASAAKVQAKAQVETAATTGLLEVVKNATAPRPDAVGPHLQSLMAMMQQQNKAAEERHKRDMEEMRERNKHEAEMERERLRNEREAERERIKEESKRFRDEMMQRQNDRDSFLAKMAEIEEKRDEFHKSAYERMLGEIGQSREAAEREIKERKDAAIELIDIQKKNSEELMKLREQMGGAASDVKVAEIVKDGIVTGIDRLGHRVDALVESGAFSNGPPRGNGKRVIDVKVGARNKDASPETDTGKQQEEKSVLSDGDIEQEVQKPWFTDLKREVVATLAARAKGRKLHGGILGQVFIENLNARKGVTTAHLHWLCSRSWADVLTRAKGAISEEEMKLLATEDGEKWYEQFAWFLSESYNQSIAQT